MSIIMRLHILLLVFYLFICAEIESVQVNTASEQREDVFSKYQDTHQNPNVKIHEAGNTTKISFLNPVGSRAPVLIKLQAFKNKWVSTSTTIKVFVAIITISLIIGNLFSILVFRLAYRSGLSKPLNLYICVDQAFKMFGNTWAIPVTAVSTILNPTYLQHTSTDPLVTYTGETFCYASRFVAEVFGSLSISNIILGKVCC